jgi:ABC-type Zn uptake system ZnuABC Zn-binding protein ZnuA
MDRRNKLFAAAIVSLCALAFLVLPASAAQYEFTLYTSTGPVHYYLNQVGGNVYSVNALKPSNDKNIATCAVSKPVALISYPAEVATSLKSSLCFSNQVFVS